MNAHCGDDTVVVGGAGRDRDEEDERDVTAPIVVCCERMSALVYLLKARPRSLSGNLLRT